MLSDEQLDVLSGALVPLYQHLEAWVISDVARRIKDTMMYTRTAELEVAALQKLGYSPARIRSELMRILRADKAFQRQVEENTLQWKREVAAKLAEITGKVQEAAGNVMGGASDMTWADDLSLWDSAGVNLQEDGTLKQITKAMQDQTKGELKNLTRTTGFRTVSGMEPAKEVYQKELDKALVKVSSGAVTKEQCVREVVQDLARSGLRTIDYDSGRSYQLDTASRMCLNTAAGQLAAQVCNANIQKTDVTLVQVSAHWGARDKGEGIKNHKEWQGKVYSIDGKLHPEEEKRIGMEIRDLQESTGYNVQEGRGDIEGLHGVNCRHNHHPFFEGISTPVKYDPEPEPKEINGRTYSYYDMLQGMRRREREIRALKREKEALEKLGEDATAVKAKIRMKTKEYNSFCDDCGIRQKPERLRVESGTTDLTKTQAWKDYEKARTSTTVAEGEKYIDIGNLKGVSLGNSIKSKSNLTETDVTEIKKAISDVAGDYDLKLERIEIGDYSDDDHKSAPIFYRAWDEDEIFNPKLVINNASDFWYDQVTQQSVLSSGYFAGSTVYEFTEHELAHVLTYQGCKSKAEYELLERSLQGMKINGVSRYSYASNDGSEIIAEAFVRRRSGKGLNKTAQAILDKYVEVWRK